MGALNVRDVDLSASREFEKSGLLLNPRSPGEIAAIQESAWSKFSLERPEIFSEAIGISTSGSTSGGLGSIIVLKKTALEASAHAVNRRLRAGRDDVWGLALPLFHVGGYSIPVRARLAGSKVAVFAEAWDAAKFRHWLESAGVTLLSLVPTQVFDLVDRGLRSPARLRAIVVGGGRLSDELHTKARALGWPVLQSFGMTECCSQIATASLEGDGRALEVLDHVDVRVDERSVLSIRSGALLRARIVFDGREGEAGGEGLTLRARLEEPVDREGWFQTSDRVEVFDALLGAEPSGRATLRILGREGESVKVLGELVDLARVRSVVEEVVLREERFKEFRGRVWVVAVPDARRENEIVLVVERPEDSAQAEHRSTMEADDRAKGELSKRELIEGELLKTLSSRLMPFERPTRVFRTPKIPRSSLGKVLSTLLVEAVIAKGDE